MLYKPQDNNNSKKHKPIFNVSSPIASIQFPCYLVGLQDFPSS